MARHQNYFKNWCDEHGITQKSLANVCQCSTATISRWLSPEGWVPSDKIWLLAKTYRLTDNQVRAFFLRGELEEPDDKEVSAQEDLRAIARTLSKYMEGEQSNTTLGA